MQRSFVTCGNIEMHLFGEHHHREDGPAIIHLENSPNEGYKAWYVNGVRHREDGPAVINPSTGIMSWYIDGKLIKQESIFENSWKEDGF